MRRVTPIAILCVGLLSGGAAAQSTDTPPPAAEQAPAAEAPAPAGELPAVVVVGQKKAPTPNKKKTTKKAKVKQPSAPVAASAQPSAGTEVGIEAAGGRAPERGNGPVDGYVASQSLTGTKTDTPLIETPRTVNVVTKDQIQDQAAQSIGQALRYVPGIMLDKYTASGVYDVYVVRGFEAPLYLDGLVLPPETTLTFAKPVLDPYQLERIEVLKGPTSALYGQAPPGGLVNAVSKRPDFVPHNEIFFQTGSFDRLETGFDFTGPVDSEGKLAYRLTGLARDADLQMDFTESERYFISPSLLWRPDRDTSITLLANVAHNDGYGPQQYVPFQLTQSSAPYGRIPYSRYLGEPDIDNSRTDQFWIGYEFAHRINEVFQVRQNLRYMDVENETLAVRTEGLISNDGRTVGRSLNYVTSDTRNFQVDTQAQADFATGALAHKVLGGIDYETGRGNAIYRFGGFSPIDAYNPIYGTPAPPISSLFEFLNRTTDTEQLGIYLQDQIKYDRWILTAGGRYDIASTDALDHLTLTPINYTDTAWTYFTGLSYMFDSGIAPYFSYSTSFQPASGFTLTSIQGGRLKPTTGEGYEAGIKYQPPGTNTLLTAAWFDFSQQNVAKPNANVPPITIQSGEVRSQGVELEAKTSINRNLDVIASYAHISALITDDPNEDVIGNRFPSVAHNTAALWAMYTWHNGMFAGLGLGAGVRYTGSQYGNELNQFKVPGYTLADLAVKYDFRYVAPNLEGLTFQLNVANLFDKYYVASCVTSKAYCGLGAERTVLATLKYEW
ncbi:TonB-dependent siderophore receptor [Hyphomicrobium methylovorum]|uniref:TonB-dependent siderophore receptor n=1 Tax=Hyphomicrobium methylovorum TaxID=84 RepID=UPI0015E68B5C|nr:TonB-dependent siderophore receptor [Hyphomicrobium methylovorum]